MYIFQWELLLKMLQKKYNISRNEQQEFAISSHQKAHEAQTKGNFKNEIVSIGDCNTDGNIRPDSTM